MKTVDADSMLVEFRRIIETGNRKPSVVIVAGEYLGQNLRFVLHAKYVTEWADRLFHDFKALGGSVDVVGWLDDQLPGFMDEIPAASVESFLTAVRSRVVTDQGDGETEMGG